MSVLKNEKMIFLADISSEEDSDPGSDVEIYTVRDIIEVEGEKGNKQ